MDYISQALSLHDDCSLPGPCVADINYLKIMTSAVKKWESIPRHQEMISNIMFNYMARLFCCTSPNSLINVIIDWIILVSYTGFHKSEWCNGHPTCFTTIDNSHRGVRPNALPVIPDDVAFCTASGQCLTDILAANNKIVVFITLHMQAKKQ